MDKLMIVVSGAPASGKTYLAKEIEMRYGIPAIIKDEFKEIMFDSIGIGGEEWGKELGRTSFAITGEVCEKICQTSSSFLVEGNFIRDYGTEVYTKLSRKYGYEVMHIYCHAQDSVLFDRYISRADSGERHEGHGKIDFDFEEYKRRMRNIQFRLDFTNTVEIDTTHIESIDYSDIFKAIDKFLR